MVAPTPAAIHQPISTWFLVLGLFLPRLTLLGAYLTHAFPPNNGPLILNVLGGIFLPRVLICLLIAFSMGYTVWFWLHLVTALIVYGFSSHKAQQVGRQN
jgi:hypothetical protein